MRLFIAGDEPFVEEVARLGRAAGHELTAALTETFLADPAGDPAWLALAAADVAVELHHGRPETKRALLRALDEALPPDALLLSSALNTSTTQAAAWAGQSERVVGFGVLPPLPDAGLVEVAAGLQTSEAALARAEAFWRELGQEPVRVADGPGLVRARVVCCLINEAAGLLLEGVATAADIDKGMRLGTNYPHGPLAWGDVIGLDAVLGVMEGLFAEWGDDRYRPAPLLRRLVTAGYLGQKIGQGFYTYDSSLPG
jgi:3-hydroxybutyryl-CoA dehydrogenase